MQLPLSANQPIFWMDGSSVNVLGNNNRVASVYEKISGNIISAVSSTVAPVWRDNVVNGLPAYFFEGGQSLKYNLGFGNAFYSGNTPGRGQPCVMYAVAQSLVFSGGNGNAIVTLGDQVQANAGLILQASSTVGGSVAYKRVDDANASTTSRNIVVDGGWHLYTIIFDGFQVISRLDGQPRDITAVSNNQTPMAAQQVVIGNWTDGRTSGGTSNSFFNGNIASVVIYSGTSVDVDTETFLKSTYGIL